jgi:MFS family permease
MALFQLPAGLLSERIGERNLLVLGTAVAGLGFIGLGLSGGFLSLLLFLFFFGFGSAVNHPLSSSIVSAAYASGGRRAALGTYNFAGDLGKFMVAGGVSLALAAGISWRAPIVSLGVFAIVASVLILIMLRTLQVGGRPEPKPKTDTERQKRGWGIRYPVGFSALCGIMIVDNGARNGFLTFVAFLLISKGFDPGVAAMAVPAILVGGMVGKLACGFLAEKIGVIRTVVLTEVGSAVGILGTLVAPEWSVFLLLPVIGVALNGTTSVLYGTVGDLVDSDRQSRAFGLFYTLGAICGIAAPLGFGLVGDAIGIPVTITIVGFAILLTVPLCLVLRPILRGLPAAAAE